MKIRAAGSIKKPYSVANFWYCIEEYCGALPDITFWSSYMSGKTDLVCLIPSMYDLLASFAVLIYLEQ